MTDSRGIIMMEKEGLCYFVFSHFAATGIVDHAFTTRKGGVSLPPFESLNLSYNTGDDPERVRQNRLFVERIFGIKPQDHLRQIHSDTVIKVEADAATGFIPADAMITDEAGLPLTVYCADCAAIFILDAHRRAIGLAHAGWRGTLQDIGGKTIQAMERSFGTRAVDCLVGISPSIGACCFLVDEDVAERFQDSFPHWKDLYKPVANKWSVDLWQTNFRLLLDRGVLEENISPGLICTACHPELFFSHRREGETTGRMAALFSIRPDNG